jgi:hypothetical protein
MLGFAFYFLTHVTSILYLYLFSFRPCSLCTVNEVVYVLLSIHTHFISETVEGVSCFGGSTLEVNLILVLDRFLQYF